MHTYSYAYVCAHVHTCATVYMCVASVYTRVASVCTPLCGTCCPPRPSRNAPEQHVNTTKKNLGVLRPLPRAFSRTAKLPIATPGGPAPPLTTPAPASPPPLSHPRTLSGRMLDTRSLRLPKVSSPAHTRQRARDIRVVGRRRTPMYPCLTQCHTAGCHRPPAPSTAATRRRQRKRGGQARQRCTPLLPRSHARARARHSGRDAHATTPPAPPPVQRKLHRALPQSQRHRRQVAPQRAH